MKLVVSEQIAPDNWDAQLCSAGGLVFHSSVWARFVTAGRPGAVPQFMSFVEADGSAAGFALGFRSRSARAVLRPVSERLTLDAPPVMRGRDGEGLAEALMLLEGHARSLGTIELFIGSYGYQGGAVALQRRGFTLSQRLEFELCLDSPACELWQAMEYKRRKNIRKAVRQGVLIEDLLPEEAVLELRRLQAASGERIARRGGPRIAFNVAVARDPVRVLVDAGVGRIIGAKVGSTVVSAGLFTFFNGLVYHTLSGHDRRALETQAPTLLLWETIKRYQGEGARRFNLGGCSRSAIDPHSPEHGVYEYKKAFGGSVLECASGSKTLRATARRVLGVLERVSSWRSKQWI